MNELLYTLSTCTLDLLPESSFNLTDQSWHHYQINGLTFGTGKQTDASTTTNSPYSLTEMT